MSTAHSKFNEATRVQMPALVHLTRLGYKYFGEISEESVGTVYDSDTNILLDVFRTQFKKLNPGHEGDTEEILRSIRQELDNDDLGKSFHDRLTRDLDEFCPDITLFVNGLPLVFVEVKKPNNHGGMVAESERMNKQRFPNKKFRRFINITQLMIFSNNMEYDSLGGIVPIQGAFYCTAARQSAPFNCFREENPGNTPIAPFIRVYP